MSAPRIHVALLAEPLDWAAELAALDDPACEVGAVASFVGRVRHDAREGQPLTHLTLEHYPGMTERCLESLAHQAVERFQLLALRIVHRMGTLSPGEPIVLVAAGAAHRKAALQAVDYVMDHIKSTIPFWKREQHGPQQRWVEARSSDEAALSAWSSHSPAAALRGTGDHHH